VDKNDAGESGPHRPGAADARSLWRVVRMWQSWAHGFNAPKARDREIQCAHRISQYVDDSQGECQLDRG
jgi:hypothetical protein